MIRPIVDLSTLPAIDGHCHPLVAGPWTLAPGDFLRFFTEGRGDTMTGHIPHTGYFRRALQHLASRLGTEAPTFPWCYPSSEQALSRQLPRCSRSRPPAN
jgi:hypothetical protein